MWQCGNGGKAIGTHGAKASDGIIRITPNASKNVPDNAVSQTPNLCTDTTGNIIVSILIEDRL